VQRVQSWEEGWESRHLESRPKAEARLDLEVSAGWTSLFYRSLCGGDALLVSTGAEETETLRYCALNPGVHPYTFITTG
jgi:hypothetical protein